VVCVSVVFVFSEGSVYIVCCVMRMYMVCVCV